MKGAVELICGEKYFAAIAVTYPEGAVCTATNGTETLSAGNTDGVWLFPIPETGSWTVRAELDESAEELVSITEEGQVVSVELDFIPKTLTLFDSSSGGDNTAVTGGWEISSSDDGHENSEITAGYLSPHNGGSSSIGSWYGGTTYIGTVNEVDVSAYSTAQIVVSYAKPDSALYVGDAEISFSAAGTYNLDISEISGEVLVEISATRPSETWDDHWMVATKIILLR